jgi:hypothetical protein
MAHTMIHQHISIELCLRETTLLTFLFLFRHLFPPLLPWEHRLKPRHSVVTPAAQWKSDFLSSIDQALGVGWKRKYFKSLIKSLIADWFEWKKWMIDYWLSRARSIATLRVSCCVHGITIFHSWLIDPKDIENEARIIVLHVKLRRNKRIVMGECLSITSKEGFVAVVVWLEEWIRCHWDKTVTMWSDFALFNDIVIKN